MVTGLKDIHILKITRHKEVKDRPEIDDTVLNRGSGKGKAALCVDALHGLCLLSIYVSDILGLIDHGKAEADIVLADVRAEGVDAGDVDFLLIRCDLLNDPGSLTLRAIYFNSFRLTVKLHYLALPVEYKALGTDYERWKLFLIGFYQCDHLDGLSESHVIGKYSSESIRGEY